MSEGGSGRTRSAGRASSRLLSLRQVPAGRQVGGPAADADRRRLRRRRETLEKRPAERTATTRAYMSHNCLRFLAIECSVLPARFIHNERGWRGGGGRVVRGARARSRPPRARARAFGLLLVLLAPRAYAGTRACQRPLALVRAAQEGTRKRARSVGRSRSLLCALAVLCRTSPREPRFFSCNTGREYACHPPKLHGLQAASFLSTIYPPPAYRCSRLANITTMHCLRQLAFPLDG